MHRYLVNVLTGMTKTCPGGPGTPLDPGMPSRPARPLRTSRQQSAVAQRTFLSQTLFRMSQFQLTQNVTNVNYTLQIVRSLFTL